MSLIAKIDFLLLSKLELISMSGEDIACPAIFILCIGLLYSTISQAVAPFTQHPPKIYIEYEDCNKVNLNELRSKLSSIDLIYTPLHSESVALYIILNDYKLPEYFFKKEENSIVVTVNSTYLDVNFNHMKYFVNLLELVTDGKCRKITGVVNTYSRYGWFKFNKVYYSMNYTVDCKQDYTL